MHSKYANNIFEFISEQEFLKEYSTAVFSKKFVILCLKKYIKNRKNALNQWVLIRMGSNFQNI